jgi:hypothetical protein
MDETLITLLGTHITDRAPFQWVKLIGRSNIVSNVEKRELLVIDRAHIVNEFEKSRAKKRTTEGMATILLWYYKQWVISGNRSRISGLIAEEIHNELMRDIAQYWRVKWEPSKHKNPANGIMNFFEMRRRQIQHKYLKRNEQGELMQKGDEGYRPDIAKRQGAVMLRTLTEALGEIETLNSRVKMLLLEWDCLFTPTPEQVLMSKEHDED